MTLTIKSWAIVVLVWALVTAALATVALALDLPLWVIFALGVFPWLIPRSVARDLQRRERADFSS